MITVCTIVVLVCSSSYSETEESCDEAQVSFELSTRLNPPSFLSPLRESEHSKRWAAIKTCLNVFVFLLVVMYQLSLDSFKVT